MLTSLSADEMLLPKYDNWSTNLSGWSLGLDLAPLLYWNSQRGHCLPLLTLGNAVKIPLKLV